MSRPNEEVPMAKKLAYERYCWFHGRIKAGVYPNAGDMAERFEISRKQAQRDIEFMRDRLNAPLVYDPARRGYGYEDGRYELPPVWFDEEELIALCLAMRLAAAVPDRGLKESLTRLLGKFLSFRSAATGPGLKDVREKVSVRNIQYYRVDEAVFHEVVSALFAGRPLRLSYYTPHKDESTERTVKPLHLLCYMGSWHLMAYCTLRDDVRFFTLSRIRSVEPVSGRVRIPDRFGSVRRYMERSFGLMQSGASFDVCLRFDPTVARWVSEQVWHPSQSVSFDPDGRLILRFPVSDLREVRREILKYGSAVEVLAPEGLRREIMDEIKKMACVYR